VRGEVTELAPAPIQPKAIMLQAAVLAAFSDSRACSLATSPSQESGAFINIKFRGNTFRVAFADATNEFDASYRATRLEKGKLMKKAAVVVSAAAVMAVTAVSVPTPVEARGGWGWGWGPGIAGGLIAGALIGGLASSAYAYGPYGYYGPGYGYYGGYAPAYYGGYGYGRPYYGGYGYGYGRPYYGYRRAYYGYGPYYGW